MENQENIIPAENEPFLEGKAESDENIRQLLREGVGENYRQHGIDETLIAEFMVHNGQVEEFVRRFAQAEGFTVREEEIAELGAILHDAAKGYGDFTRHGEEGGKLAEAMLGELGMSAELARSVRYAIERHMGEEGYPARTAKEKHGADHEYPGPKTRVGELLYKCDILTQLTPEGISKIVALRARDKDNLLEDEAAAQREGITVEEARQLSALRSAKESLDIILHGGEYPFESLKACATEYWNRILTEYPFLAERL